MYISGANKVRIQFTVPVSFSVCPLEEDVIFFSTFGDFFNHYSLAKRAKGAPVAEKAPRYFSSIRAYHSLGCFKHTPRVGAL